VKIYEKAGTVRLHTYVQPRAARSEVVGEHGDSIKIRITAPPVEGEANAELEKFIAKLLGVAASRVEVVSGTSSRRKVVAIEGMTVAAVTAMLERALRKPQ
jgi:hypothetical protein